MATPIIPVKNLSTQDILYGDRTTQYRWEVLEHSNGVDQLVGVLDGVKDGDLSWTQNAAVKGRGKVKVVDLAQAQPGMLKIGDLTLESTRLRPVMTMGEVSQQTTITLSSKMSPFGVSVPPGVAVQEFGDSGLPGWAGTAVGALWNGGQIAYPAGEPVEVAPAYGCALRTSGGNNPVSLYGSVKITATEFIIMVTSWASTDITVYVDRQPVSADPVLTDPAGGYRFVRVSGLSAGTHQVDFVVGWGSNFLQIIAPAGSTFAPGDVPAFRLGLVGDSYTDSGLAPYYAGLARELWRLTGWAIVQLGQGSTGYTNDGASSGDLSKSIYGSTSRINALVAGNVDAVLGLGSVNDGGSAPAIVGTAVTTWASKVKEALGMKPVIVVGVEPLNIVGGDPSTWDAINTAVLTAARAADNVVGVIDWRGEHWLTGTGSVSNPQGDGNQDTYIGLADGSDTVHPNFQGQKFLAGKFIDFLSRLSYQETSIVNVIPDIPWGTFLVTQSGEDWDETARVLELELLDRCTVPSQDEVDQSYSVVAGTNILQEVRAILATCNEYIVIDEAVALATLSGMAWEAGTSKLKIINDLLDVAGYNALWMDGWGNLQTTPRVLPADRSIIYELLGFPRELVDGEKAIYQPDWTRAKDSFKVPNKVIAVQAAGGEDQEALVGTWTNEDPDSPYSYQSRGRWITQTLDSVECPDGTTLSIVNFLQNRARTYLVQASAVQAQVKVSFLPIPVRVGDVLRFAHSKAGIDSRHVITSLSLDLSSLGLMKATLQEVIAL